MGSSKLIMEMKLLASIVGFSTALEFLDEPHFITNLNTAKCECLWYDAFIENPSAWPVKLDLKTDEECKLFAPDGKPSNDTLDQYAAILAEGCSPDFRNFNLDALTQKAPLAANLDALRGYGCWCSMDDFWAEGSGRPVNELDNACRRVHLNYRCLSRFDSTSCDVKAQKYLTIHGMGNGDLESQCQIVQNLLTFNNPDFDVACATRKCAIEVGFMGTLLEFATTPGMMLNPEFLHKGNNVEDFQGRTVYGKFDFKKQCGENGPVVNSGPGGDGGSPTNCCGLYPNRFPYHPVTSVCCDNKVEPIGNC